MTLVKATLKTNIQNLLSTNGGNTVNTGRFMAKSRVGTIVNAFCFYPLSRATM